VTESGGSCGKSKVAGLLKERFSVPRQGLSSKTIGSGRGMGSDEAYE